MNIDAFVALHDSEQEAALEAVQELKNQLLEQHSELMEQQNELFDREEQLLEKEEQLQYQKVETEVVEYNLKKERDLNERLALSNQTLVAKNGTLPLISDNINNNSNNHDNDNHSNSNSSNSNHSNKY